MTKKRRPPIAKSLVKNSKSAIFAAIEIHNKPIFPYRYEVVVLLVLNAWELILKAYIYKFEKNVKLFFKDGTTKPFLACLGLVQSRLGKPFLSSNENLKVLYAYRNRIAHFHYEELDLVVYSLLRKNIIFFTQFSKTHFQLDLSVEAHLVLLPIGFKKFFSPLEFISNTSVLKNASAEVIKFINSIIESTTLLDKEGVAEPIIMDFKMNLTNINRIENADIIAGINNPSSPAVSFNVVKKSGTYRLGKEGTAITITRDKSKSKGLLLHEELSEGIFDEINNVIDTNRLLSLGKKEFVLGQSMYYRIYAERHHVNHNISNFELLARAGLLQFYGPFLFWLSHLPEQSIVAIFEDLLESKSPYINNLIRLSILLGPEMTKSLSQRFDEKYRHLTQAPQYYYTFLESKKKTTKNPIFKALKANPLKKLKIPDAPNLDYQSIYQNPSIGINHLSKICLKIFKDSAQVSLRGLARELDFNSYSEPMIKKAVKIEEIIQKDSKK